LASPTIAAPLYIAEIAPAQWRGRLAGLFQFNIVFGIVVAFASNAALAGIGENAWRWMLGVAAFPSIVYTVLTFGIPESPRWLIGSKGDREAGSRILHMIRPELSATGVGGESGRNRAVGYFQRDDRQGAILDEPPAHPNPPRDSHRVFSISSPGSMRSSTSHRGSLNSRGWVQRRHYCNRSGSA
jgi:hypothetical protein